MALRVNGEETAGGTGSRVPTGTATVCAAREVVPAIKAAAASRRAVLSCRIEGPDIVTLFPETFELPHRRMTARSRCTLPGYHLDLRVQQILPVAWHSSARTRCWLRTGMRLRWRQGRAIKLGLRLKVPEPVLARLEAANHWMPRMLEVFCGMLARGVVATTDVATFSAAAEMKPPRSCSLALDTTWTARNCSGLDASHSFAPVLGMLLIRTAVSIVVMNAHEDR